MLVRGVRAHRRRGPPTPLGPGLSPAAAGPPSRAGPHASESAGRLVVLTVAAWLR